MEIVNNFMLINSTTQMKHRFLGRQMTNAQEEINNLNIFINKKSNFQLKTVP